MSLLTSVSKHRGKPYILGIPLKQGFELPLSA